MRVMTLMVAVLAGFFSLNAQASQPFEMGVFKGGEVFSSRCHMDECMFTKVLKGEYKTSKHGELMVRTLEDIGSVPQDQANNHSKIVWQNKPRHFTAVCSYTKPRVYFEYDGELVEHLLNLSPDGIVYGYQVGSALGYFRACHNFNAGEVGLPHAIDWFGYDVVQD